MSKRLIDLLGINMEEVDTSDCTDVEDILSAVVTYLSELPTVDAVEVVRCGDCWAYNQSDCPMSGSPGRVSVSDFCSYGERRTDG